MRTRSLPLLSISRESNSGLKGCVRSAYIILSRSVSRLWWTGSNVSCCLPITPLAFLMVFSSLYLSCLGAFPPEQTQLKVRTLLMVDKNKQTKKQQQQKQKKPTSAAYPKALKGLGFLRQKRRKWTCLMISLLFRGRHVCCL